MLSKDVVSSERAHIAFFGVRNAGKSSVVNAVTGQNLSLVSDVAGTTTDPVKKAMEILPLGPCVIIDTPGIDDEGELGKMRVGRTMKVLDSADAAVLVVDSSRGLCPADEELCGMFRKKEIPFVVALNKDDLGKGKDITAPDGAAGLVRVSAATGEGIHELKEKIARLISDAENSRRIIADLISQRDVIVLVVPIDSAAPKGRLILPQQQTIRDILEAGAMPIVCRDTELTATLNSLAVKPRIVVTDSQAFGNVSKLTPDDIPLTSFSILFARYKGILAQAVSGVKALRAVRDGDKILISEGCTHHRQCEDIGTVKLPAWIRNYTKAEPIFEFSSGGDFPDSLHKYKLVIHCGGCTLTEREMRARLRKCTDTNTPITNYGTAIAAMHGILERSLEPFPDILKLL